MTCISMYLSDVEVIPDPGVELTGVRAEAKAAAQPVGVYDGSPEGKSPTTTVGGGLDRI